jgi:hypothetical protein
VNDALSFTPPTENVHYYVVGRNRISGSCRMIGPKARTEALAYAHAMASMNIQLEVHIMHCLGVLSGFIDAQVVQAQLEKGT